MTEKTKFKIKTEVFEGPLDLLLNLIEKRKLLISDISLAKITDDYIKYVEEHQMHLADSAQFVLIASTLLLIKSKSLLPTLDLTQEEEDSIGDLELRLKLYKKIQDAVIDLKNSFGKNILFQSEGVSILEPVFVPSKKTTVGFLHETVASIISNLPKKEVMQKATIKKIISLDEMMKKLTDRITKNLRMSFKDFSGASKGISTPEHKHSVIITFLAMLELVKQNAVVVEQESRYSDMHIESKKLSVPNYS